MARVQIALVVGGWLFAFGSVAGRRLRRRHDHRWTAAMEVLGTLPRQRSSDEVPPRQRMRRPVEAADHQ